MCGIRQSGQSRTPGRIIGSVALLCDRHPDWAWLPLTKPLKSARCSVYIHVVQEDSADFEPDTPAYPKIYKHAARVTGAAAEVACKALRGNRVSL